jgi:hypothetical protein
VKAIIRTFAVCSTCAEGIHAVMHEELRGHQKVGGHATACFRRSVPRWRSHYTVECIVRLVILVCRASSIRRPHTRTFIASSNHCAIVAEEKSSYHISHIIFALSRVITSVLQHGTNNKREKCIQYFVRNVRKGREFWTMFKSDTKL